MAKTKKAMAHAFVLDGSVALAWCFPDEKAPYPQSVLDSLALAQAFVPSLWHLEMGNCLLVGERRKRSSQADTVNWIAFLNSLPITLDDQTITRALSDILNLARAHNLSVYDAAYLDLAIRLGLPLASLDEPLKAAAKAVGVPEYKP
jgi:predicted nucleic acid-binding protein